MEILRFSMFVLRLDLNNQKNDQDDNFTFKETMVFNVTVT